MPLIIQCDYCNTRRQIATEDEAVAEYSAECAGWVTKGPKTHQCPECAKKELSQAREKRQ